MHKRKRTITCCDQEFKLDYFTKLPTTYSVIRENKMSLLLQVLHPIRTPCALTFQGEVVEICLERFLLFVCLKKSKF